MFLLCNGTLGQLSDLQMPCCQILWQEAAAVAGAQNSKQAASGSKSDSSSNCSDSDDINAQA